jgi:hypothetical protein
MLRFKVGLVALLSCLALLVGMFGSTGVASAQSTQAAQGQAQCRTYTVVNSRYREYKDLDTGRYSNSQTFYNGHYGVFVSVGGRRVFHPVTPVNLERVTYVTVCGNHRSTRTAVIAG